MDVLKVSIVTVSFNQAEFLERTIRSVIDQDYPNIEYIIVDPGSTDGSRELIKKYESSIARAIFEPDRGAAEGLTKGFSAATGDIFGFLNSDDVFYPGAISAAVEFLSKHRDIDVVSGHAKIIGPKDQVLRLTYSDRMSILTYLYQSAALIQPSTFFRRSSYERTPGFNPANRATWDGELFFEMALSGCRFGRSDRIWSGYRLHDKSITVSKKTVDAIGEVYARLFERVMGRKWNRWDACLGLGFRVWKHMTNLRNSYERILRGPIFGRVVK